MPGSAALLKLPDVTVVAIANVAQALTKRALVDTLDRVWPKAWYNIGGEDAQATPWPEGYATYADVLWHFVPDQVYTSHILTIQWDGWVLKPDYWTDDFLAYDYVGATWPWHSRYKVGNGGFSLRSVKLMKAVASLGLSSFFEEDEQICRALRPELESLGFTFAPEALADRFSFEHNTDLAGRTFGFHGPFNFNRVLTRDEVRVRRNLADVYALDKTDWATMLMVA